MLANYVYLPRTLQEDCDHDDRCWTMARSEYERSLIMPLKEVVGSDNLILVFASLSLFLPDRSIVVTVDSSYDCRADCRDSHCSPCCYC